jgi:hypothetical protein
VAYLVAVEEAASVEVVNVAAYSAMHSEVGSKKVATLMRGAGVSIGAVSVHKEGFSGLDKAEDH